MKNVLKKINQRFKPAVLTDEQIIKLFKIPYDRYDELCNKVNNGTKSESKKVTRLRKVYYLENAIDILINEFTLAKTSDEEFIDRARRLQHLFPKKKIKITRLYNDAGFELLTKDLKIKVYKVYKYFSNILEAMPILNTNERNGECHFTAIEFATLLALSGVESEVVSGYVYELANNLKYSHSWVEFMSEKGTPLVFDGNRGAIMTKEGYYKLKHPSDISRISHKDIVCEQTIIKKLRNVADSWANKLYFHDREMALKVFEQHFGRKFVPKDYDECMKNPSSILKLDEINDIEPPQRETL